MTYFSTVIADGASYFWETQETSGTSAADSVGTNTGTYTGGFTLGVAGPPGIGTGVLLDGSTGLVTTQNIGLAYIGPWSAEIWFKTGGPGGLLTYDNATSGGNANVGMYVGSDNKLYFAIFTTGVISVTSPATVADGKWHQGVMKMNPSNNMTLYLDGHSVAGNSNTTALGLLNAWQLGDFPSPAGWTNNTTQFLNGSLTAVAVYNTTELSDAQVLNHYNLGNPPPGQLWLPNRMPLGV